MKICILCAVIMILLRSDACADETNQNNLITTYDPGQATSESKNFARLPRSVGITADDQPHHHPEHYGHVKFHQSPERPIKFEGDAKEHGYSDIDKADPGSLLADVTFEKEGSNKNDRNFNSDAYGFESNNLENKIKFEGNDEQENFDDQENNDENDEPKNASHVVFEDDGKADYGDPDYSDEFETKLETTNKRIKFENQDNESNLLKSGRVVFKDDSYDNQESNRKKKRKPRRKPHFQGKQTDPAQTAPNSPYPGLGYPGYPGVGYPGSGYPGPVDPSAVYPTYPTHGYPTPGYPYPNYPNPYGSIAYSTPGYPGYQPYPAISPGYAAYPTYGYQVPGDQRPPANPVAYPSPVQAEPSGHRDTRYLSQEYAGGSQSSGAPPPSAPQGGQPGPLYPGPEYPYYQGYPVPGYPPAYASDPNSQYPPQNQAQYIPPVYPGVPQQGYQSGLQRPSRRPKSLTHRAVSAVAEALTSIALYDDYQCVPKILCEVAGGSTSSSTLLKASTSLQPLLSLLQAYNGVSSSPLFIFGHAAVTGMAAKGNPAACHRAYPECPTDPEKLINYLNNHNGGFFRFFGQPEAPQQQQNLEQFYNYLSGQNGAPQQPPQKYGFLRPYGYGFPHQNPYAHPTQPYNYGHNYYNEKIGYRDAKKNDSEVEGRIQNKPAVNIIEADSDLDSDDNQDNVSKWSFPGEYNELDKVKITKRPERRPKPGRLQQSERPPRGSKTLKFPDDRSDDRREIQMIRYYPRREKHVFFPGQGNFQIKYTNYQTTTPVNSEEYYFDHKHNFYVKRPKALKTDDVVYVVRGNGDPNHPEVVRVRPGQKI